MIVRLGFLGIGGEGPGQVEDADAAGAVVVGAVEDVVLEPADVIEMGADDDRLGLERRIGAFDHRRRR